MTVVFVLGPTKLFNKAEQLLSNATPENGYEMEIMYDGDHYKLDYPILSDKNSEIYISLPDIQLITDTDVKKNGNSLTLTYLDNSVTYQNSLVKKSNAKENEIKNYKLHNELVYLPEEHIEKYLGIKVDYYLDSKFNTISLLSPTEQQLENVDREIGTTIFLHKSNVPQSKYEPRNGIYLGSYVIQDEYINADMNTFNEVTKKQHASFFRYVGYGQPFPTEWAEEVIKAGGFPQIAWEPNNGLEEVNDDEYMRQFARDANTLGVPVLLRYASEMNGNWTAYSGNPELYIEKWKVVHDVMEEVAPNVMMLWNVFTMPEDSIDDYYPGDPYVDYVGVNIYNVVYHNDNLEDKSDFEDPLRLLDFVYNTYSDTKPIVIGEFGATNYTVTDGLYHMAFAEEKIKRMYRYLPELYPRVKFIYYFDVNNLINAPEGRKINNYAITENERVKNAYANSIQSESYLTTIQNDPSTEETYSYRDFLFYYKDELYVDQQFVEEYLMMEIKELHETQFSVSYNGKTASISRNTLQINKAAFFEKRTINGISLDEIIKEFNLEHKYDGNTIHIYQ